MKGIYKTGDLPDGRVWVEIDSLDGLGIVGEGWTPLEALKNAQHARHEYNQGLRALRGMSLVESGDGREVGG